MESKIDYLSFPSGTVEHMYNQTFNLVSVNRPPYSENHPVPSNMFFSDEFSQCLENIVMCLKILLITGDFKFHLDCRLHRDVITPMRLARP